MGNLSHVHCHLIVQEIWIKFIASWQSGISESSSLPVNSLWNLCQVLVILMVWEIGVKFIASWWSRKLESHSLPVHGLDNLNVTPSAHNFIHFRPTHFICNRAALTCYNMCTLSSWLDKRYGNCHLYGIMWFRQGQASTNLHCVTYLTARLTLTQWFCIYKYCDTHLLVQCWNLSSFGLLDHIVYGYIIHVLLWLMPHCSTYHSYYSLAYLTLYML